MKIIVILTVSIYLIFSSCTSTNESTSIDDAKKKGSEQPVLESWNEGKAKKAIVNFVTRATDSSNSGYIEPKDRIAVFDNDGTLWAEQPNYFQFIFAMDQIKALAPEHPEWRVEQPFKAVLENDKETMKTFHTKDILTLVMATHGGLTQEEFQKEVIAWNNSSEHPKFKRPFKELVYKPMLELLDYLQQNSFKTYIVSGGGVYFMRALVSDVYKIPSEQIIGSTITTNFKLENGKYVIERTPELDFINDKEGKPININKIIGKKPVFCAGNSDGDLAMMQYTASNSLPYLNLFIHHTDTEREWAYDSLSHVGRLKEGLIASEANNWTIVNMKNDWKTVFTFESVK